jgi:hypothetical protein
MAKQIAKLLKASIQETSDLKEIAKMLSKKGRGGDTMLAHITPKEAALLKDSGGAGTVNPDTGLLEFYDDEYRYDDDGIFNRYIRLNEPDITTGGYKTGEQFSYSPAETSYGFNKVESPDYASPTTYETGQDRYTGGVKTYDELQQMAAQQYGGKYAPVQPNQPYSGREYYADIEFPPISSARYSLLGGVPAAEAAAPMNYGSWLSSPAGQEYARQAGLTDVDIATQQAGFGRPSTVPPEQPSIVDKALIGPAKSAFEYLKENVTPTEALRLGTAAFGAVQGRRAMQEAQRQREQSVAEQKALGDPYKQMGSELQRQAQSGEMTPQSAQAFQALRAQLAQGVETRGGVGAAQAQAQLEMFRNNLLQNQFNYGLQVSQIGDQIALGAIRTGMQLDRQLLEANQNFYTNLAQFASGGVPGTQQVRRV